MEGDSSKGDSPKRKRMRLDDPEEEFPDPAFFAIQEEEDEFPDPAFCAIQEEEDEFPDPVFCEIQEQMVDVVPERQLLGPGPHQVIGWSSNDEDDDAVGDYESVDQITEDEDEDEDDELDQEKLLARIENSQRAYEERPRTDEENHRNLKFMAMLIKGYGTDDFEEIDFMIERCCLAEKNRIYAEELNKQKVEQILDYEEIQRVDKILQEVVDRTLPVPGIPRPNGIVTDVEFFLLDPWMEDKEFMHRDAEERSLDLYYKRLFPNLPSARNLFDLYLWNRLPEVDAEYSCLYSELCRLVKPDEKSYTLFVKSTLKNRVELHAKAVEIAKQREIKKLIDVDITECLEDVLKEGDTIAEHKLKEEYDMFLLDCEYNPKLRGTKFTPKEDTPVFENVVCFQLERQQWKFNTWMEKRRSLNLGKAEHQEALKLLHEKNLREDCGIRIRYVRFKRAWAKERGLISEETCL